MVTGPCEYAKKKLTSILWGRPSKDRKRHSFKDVIYILKYGSQFFFSIFTGSCNHERNLILEHFHHPPKETLYLLAVTLHSLSIPPAPGNHESTFCPMDLPILDTKKHIYRMISFICNV